MSFAVLLAAAQPVRPALIHQELCWSEAVGVCGGGGDVCIVTCMCVYMSGVCVCMHV